MLTLHHLEYSQSFRILWLLEELEAEFELVTYERDSITLQAPNALKEISPLGSAPVITDGDLVLAESNAIIDYLLDKFPDSGLRPLPGNIDQPQYLFWFHASQGSMMTLIFLDAVFQLLISRVPWLLRGIVRAVLKQATLRVIKPRLQRLLQQAEQDLTGKPWFGGETLTAADIAMCYPMESARSRGYITDEHPQCLAWFERVHQCPSFISAKRKDGKDEMVISY